LLCHEYEKIVSLSSRLLDKQHFPSLDKAP
jgi:hypothetical protein